ncbi:hypothetical protein [Cellulomonas endophytica]|uniref:hypothetical protein n=1 Tax=Cellulomonas endophytica TaxID=2494735 RepID=UPI001012B641|nr:hypothetical protein [Cellulomonas endophytica]
MKNIIGEYAVATACGHLLAPASGRFQGTALPASGQPDAVTGRVDALLLGGRDALRGGWTGVDVRTVVLRGASPVTDPATRLRASGATPRSSRTPPV